MNAITSLVYRQLDQQTAEDCLYFHPKETNVVIDCNVRCNLNYTNSTTAITTDSLVLYYPGAFGAFHDGHLSVVVNAYRACKDIADHVVIVISPAHSDYVRHKYSNSTINSQLKYRYDQIRAKLDNLVIDGSQVEYMIDLSASTNYRCDNNATDLIDNFLKQNNCDINQMRYPPTLICGKDRDQFTNLPLVTDLISVFYCDDVTNESTSKSHLAGNIAKKDIIVRCDNYQQYKLFYQYFHNQYNKVSISLLSNELALAQSLIDKYRIKTTICKDYASIANYVKFSRNWINCVDHNGFIFDIDQMQSLAGQVVLDSDIFTGKTRDFVRQQFNIDLVAVYDNIDSRYTELIDISDLYSDWNYPYVDVSYRASMIPFDYSDHLKYQQFVSQLNMIERK